MIGIVRSLEHGLMKKELVRVRELKRTGDILKCAVCRNRLGRVRLESKITQDAGRKFLSVHSTILQYDSVT
ncbi:hypothetical protein CLV41_10427 [Roseibium marinum]|uniref:Uncharacterized protein n=1 Tax=Roseibium marinum TaxID=281252 RepID=A0A2S3UUT0_9HYPH|nr:hypothetical protein CLV41_10427 [Roseibium marinum]